MSKKINIGLFLLLNIFLIEKVSANEVVGEVNVRGSIVESACAIDLNSIDQTIDMGTISYRNLFKGNTTAFKRISISLVNCISRSASGKHWDSFSVTFEGISDGNYFKIFGEAKGISVALWDIDGGIIRPGYSINRYPLTNGNNSLKYDISLVPNNEAVKTGEFQTSIRFKLDYF